MKINRKTALATGGLLLLLCIFLLSWYMQQANALPGDKAITVEVVHRDGTSKEFPVATYEAYLGPALVEAGVVEDNQDQFGLYILTADGEKADEGKQEWWCVTRGGEAVLTGADATPIVDSEHYEITLTTGY